MKRPAFQFYPGDWLRDPGLRLCSAAARGLWIDMIAVMHEATPYGHLLVNGTRLTALHLAKLTGEAEADVGRWLAELEAQAVFSRLDDGTIFSRRMVRDEQKREEWRVRQQNHRDGGRDPVGDSQHDTPRDVTQLSPDESRQGHAVLHSSSSSPSLRSGEKRPRKRAAVSGTPLPDGFGISPAVRSWAEGKGYGPYLELHLEHFLAYAKAGTGGGKPVLALDWDAKFRTSITADWGDVRRKAQEAAARANGRTGKPAPPPGAPWYIVASQIEKRGREKGLKQGEGEPFPVYRDRVYAANDVTPDMVRKARVDFGMGA